MSRIYALSVSVVFLVASALLMNPAKIHAEDLVITGNGSNSDNQIVVSQNSNTTVSQSNQANVDNQVNTSATTGNNSASSNTGGSNTITTGDTNSSTNITNNLNSSTVQANCCNSSDSSSTITGNGSDTQNTITNSTNSQNTITVTQTANITNNIQGHFNTGNNVADSNGGNVYISTGNIHANIQIDNKNINSSVVNIPQGTINSVSKISGNGEGSKNILDNQNRLNQIINIYNQANIKNTENLEANTGFNQALSNLGNVVIKTGDISINSLINNGPINSSNTTTNCGCNENKPSAGNQPNAPAPSTPLNNSSSSSSSVAQGAGEVLSAATAVGGQIMPATGNYWLMLMTMISGLMFLLGLYLRFHPGQDPGQKLAILAVI